MYLMANPYAQKVVINIILPVKQQTKKGRSDEEISVFQFIGFGLARRLQFVPVPERTIYH